MLCAPPSTVPREAVEQGAILPLVCSLLRPRLGDAPGDVPVHHRPQGDVGQEEDRGVENVDKQNIGYRESKRNRNYMHHRGTLLHAQSHKLVVDMAFVGHEGIAPTADAVNHHTYDIQQRDHQERERYDNGAGNSRVFDGIVLPELYGEDSQQQSYCQRARVAHEYLAPAPHLAEDVEVEERHQSAQGRRRQQCIQPPLKHHKHEAESDEGYDAQPRRQPVDAVNEVQGVDDVDYPQHRERHGHINRQIVDAEQPVQVVEVQPRRHNQNGAQHLEEELDSVAAPRDRP